MKNPIYKFIPEFEHVNDRKIWVCSDFHAFHVNMAKGTSKWDDVEKSCRDFDNEIEMTEHIADNVNQLVDVDDVLFHLGDWSFNGKDKVERLRDMINCQTVINLYGNHDRHIRADKKLQRLFFWVGDYLELRYKGYIICMCHYPIASWNYIGKNGIMLHGHCHHNLSIDLGRCIDVGIDGYNLKPITMDHALSLAIQKPIRKVDSHDENTSYY